MADARTILVIIIRKMYFKYLKKNYILFMIVQCQIFNTIF